MILLKAITRIVVISDTHTGHRVALWPENFKTEEGQEIKPSKHQLVLGEYWKDFWSKDAKEAEYVILAGDMCEGTNYAEGGKYLMTPNLDEQKRANLSLTKPKIKGKKVRGIWGSCYHGSKDMELDKQITEKLGGKDKGIVGNLRLKKTKKIINYAHACSEAVLYRPMAADRASLLLDAAEGVKKIDFHVDLWIRAHWHWFNHQENESRHLILNPGWKLWAPIRKKGAKMYERYISMTIGGTVIDIFQDFIFVKSYRYPILPVYDELEIA